MPEKFEIPATQPSQKIATKLKGKKWAQENLKYWEQVLFSDELSARKLNMFRNDNLYINGIMSQEEVMKVTNPHNIKDMRIPEDMKNYPIAYSRIQTLLGEEIKRYFNWKVFVTNRDAVSEKENQKKDIFIQFVSEQIKAEVFDQEQAEAKLKKLEEYLNYDYQDIKEKGCNELLHHYNLYLDLKTVNSKVWKDILLYGEGIIDVDCINGKPHVERVDPKTIYWSSNGENQYIDDADAVIREYYLPLGQVIDHYYEDLTGEDIKELETLRDQLTASNRQWSIGETWNKDSKTGVIIPDQNNPIYLQSDAYNRNNQGAVDDNGNIRVLKLRWKSLKKVGKLSYPDEAGEMQETWVDETYKVDDTLGEAIEWFWINEPYECTQLGEDIIVKYGPRKISFRKLDNKSYCSLGYVGTRLDQAIYDIMKEYQLKYNAYMYRTERGMVKALGKIGILDTAMVPDDWDIDMWMYYATEMGWAVVDSFKEAKKGAAQGKIAGQMGTRADSINLEQGQFIQQNMIMLQYLESQMDLVCGISPQRRGQVKADQGLGVMQEAQEASATITESYFNIHDNIKTRTLERLLEVAKYALRNKVESIQYVTSELTSKVFEIDGDLINEAEYGIRVGNAVQDAQAIDTLRRATEIALQTGEVDLIQLMDIFSNESAAEIKRRIQKSVNEKRESAQKQQEAEMQLQQQAQQTQLQIAQMTLEEKEKDRELQRYKIDTESRTKIAIAELNALGLSQTPEEDTTIIDQAEMSLDYQKHQETLFDKEKDRQQKQKDKDKDVNLKKEELRLKEKEIKSKEKIEDLKAKTALRVARANKNKYDKK